jgi:hypothetical protein
MQHGVVRIEQGDVACVRYSHTDQLFQVNGETVMAGHVDDVVRVLDDWLHQATLIQAGGDARFGDITDRGPAVR